MLPKGRYYYEVDGETRETDVWALGGWTTGVNSVEHAWFVECKQREEDKYWCFFPQAENVRDLSRNAFIVDVLEERDGLAPWKLQSLQKQYVPSLPIVGDGIQVYQNQGGNWDTDSHGIQNALRQAIMPIADHVPWVFHRNFVLSYRGQEIELYLPVVVTTAQLFVLRDDADSKALSTFENVEQCFRRESAVISTFTTPSYVTNYWRERILTGLRSMDSKFPDVIKTNTYLKSFRKSPNETFQTIAERLTASMPTRVLIVEADSMQSVLSSYLAELDKAVATAMGAKS